MLNNISKNETTGQISIIRTNKSQKSFLPRPIRPVYPDSSSPLSPWHTPEGEETTFKKKPLSTSIFRRISNTSPEEHTPGTLLGRRVFHSSLDVSHVRSRIGSFDNILHQPQDSNFKIFSEKPSYTHIRPTIPSCNKEYTVYTGEREKIFNQKLELSHVTPLVPYRDNELYEPGGGDINIPKQKLNFREAAKPKIDSRSTYQPKISEISIPIQKLRFRELATTRIDSKRSLGFMELPKNTRHLIDLLTVSLPDLRKEGGGLQHTSIRERPDHSTHCSTPPRERREVIDQSQLDCKELKQDSGETVLDNEL